MEFRGDDRTSDGANKHVSVVGHSVMCLYSVTEDITELQAGRTDFSLGAGKHFSTSTVFSKANRETKSPQAEYNQEKM